MIYSKGISWIDDTRIPFSTNDDKRIGKNYQWASKAEPFGDAKTLLNKEGWDTKGRFTPNLLVSDDMLNDGSVSNSSGGKGEKTLGTLGRNGIYNKGWGKDETADGLGGYGDKGSNSRYYDIDLWFNKLIYGL